MIPESISTHFNRSRSEKGINIIVGGARSLNARLRINAAIHGRSMEEACDILRSALSIEPANGQSLVDSIRARLAPLAGVELEIPLREDIRAPLDLSR